jgi:uncharacterized membrane protein YgaE (UPF0421/DUF939 family)
MSFLKSVRAQREIRFSQALIFAAQAVICTLAALAIYNWAGAPGGMWAAVSAILVLQLHVQKSLAASIVRVLANLIGVGAGVIVSMAFPHGPAAVAVSLVVVILLCELLRLDLGLRSACASLLIVTLSPDPALLHRGEQRAVAVIVGCGIALILQLALHWAWGQHHTAAPEESE